MIGNTERGILYRNKQILKILMPGTYLLPNLIGKYQAEIFDIVKFPELKNAASKALFNMKSLNVESSLLKVKTSSREVAVIYADQKAIEIMEPSEERLFWKGLSELQVKRFDISREFEVDKETLKDLSLIIDERKVLIATVPEQFSAMLMESGVIVKQLTPGRYGFWRSQRALTIIQLDSRMTALEISGQEMLTKDKVSLRINLAVTYRLLDAVKAIRSLSDIQSEIYRTGQLALRQAVGEKTLDELLENKEALNKGLSEELSGVLGVFGIEVSRTGVKDIILPGDMRTLLNQVVEAEKAAQAQNIRRREETAATRSLLNTAKMMESNPILIRLKELESVERISEKVEKLTVYDGLKGVMHGLVSLKD